MLYERAKGKPGDVTREALDIVRGVSEFGIRSPDRLPCVVQEHALTDDAKAPEPYLFILGQFAEQFTDNNLKFLKTRTHILLNQMIKRLRWLDQFPGNDLAAPGRTALVEHEAQPPPDKDAQPLLGALPVL